METKQLYRLKISSHSRRHGQSLIGLLAVVLILFGLYFAFLGPRRDKNGVTQPSVAKQSINRANDTATTSDLSQIQMAITMYKDDNDGKPPASLDELKNSAHGRGIPAEMWVTQDGRPLAYDPATGMVSVPPSAGVAGAAPNTAAPNSPNSNPATGGVNINIPQPKAPSEME